MENKKYNGWNTYATWLVNVTITSDIRWDDYEEAYNFRLLRRNS
jgi:hypothetical protein